MIDEVMIIELAIKTTPSALFKAALEIFLLKSTVSSLFLIAERADAARIIIVTVLIPPAVPTGEPPINIRIIEKIEVDSLKYSWGMVKNPAVLVVIDWKREA